MRKINTLLYDLDGTLVDSNDLILTTFKKTLMLHIPERSFSDSELLEMMGPPLHETFRRLFSSQVKIDAMIDTYRSLYLENESLYLNQYPKTKETLDYFHKLGFKQAIVTTKFSVSATPSVISSGLFPYIDFIIGLEHVQNPKPDPEPVLLALSKISNVDIAIMIGDNPSDILSGKHAGILTCGVGWTYKVKELKASKPDFWIEDWQDLITLVNQFNKEEI